MAERIVQEESLITVADAIREKTGSTDGLVFPNGFVEAIAGISEGAKIATGKLIGSQVVGASGYTTTPIVIEHSLGIIPDFVIVFDTNGTGYTPTNVEWGLYAAMYQKGVASVYTVSKTAAEPGANLNLYTSTTVVGISDVTAQSFSIGGKYAYPLGHTYFWIAIAGLS